MQFGGELKKRVELLSIFKTFSPSLGRLIGGFYGGPVEAVEKGTDSARR